MLAVLDKANISGNFIDECLLLCYILFNIIYEGNLLFHPLILCLREEVLS